MLPCKNDDEYGVGSTGDAHLVVLHHAYTKVHTHIMEWCMTSSVVSMISSMMRACHTPRRDKKVPQHPGMCTMSFGSTGGSIDRHNIVYGQEILFMGHIVPPGRSIGSDPRRHLIERLC